MAPAAAWRWPTTKCCLRQVKRCSLPSMPGPARKCGARRWPTTNPDITCRSRRWSSVARCWLVRQVGSSESAASSRRTISIAARKPGGPTRFRRRARPAARPGRKATSGRPAAGPCGSPAITIPRRIWRSGERATAARGWAISVPETICTPTRRSRSMSRPEPSKATSSIIRMIRGTGTRCRLPSSSITSAAAERSAG